MFLMFMNGCIRDEVRFGLNEIMNGRASVGFGGPQSSARK